MNKKHTLGSWEYLFGKTPETATLMEVLPKDAWNGKGWKFKDIHIGVNGRVIAQIIHRTTEDGVSVEEFEANAKLIAAAPDLLQAVIDTKKHLDNYGPDVSREGANFEYQEHLEVYTAVTNAINKATK